MNFYGKYVKRGLDILISGIALLILSPVILVLAILVRRKLGSPVIFRQERPGYREKIFTLCKFRTMTDARDEKGELLPDSVRLTKFGSLLRKTSLDELPQLLNILRGDMAIIGPRPALWSQEDLIAERDQYGANDVRPGLTGWAQINGRDELTIEEKSAYDGEYVRKISFSFDCKCFFGTIGAVLRHDGVVEGAQEPDRTTVHK